MRGPLLSTHGGAEDLLDTAAVWALQNRSSIFAVNQAMVPGGAPATALFRYEIRP